MSDTRDAGTPPADPAAPPPLPPLQTNLGHLVIPLTGAWFVLLIGLAFFVPTLRTHHTMIWFWTALAGGVLGIIGLGVYFWQRWAARRGTRSSNRMALDEKF